MIGRTDGQSHWHLNLILETKGVKHQVAQANFKRSQQVYQCSESWRHCVIACSNILGFSLGHLDWGLLYWSKFVFECGEFR